jgi:hypothetical protein
MTARLSFPAAGYKERMMNAQTFAAEWVEAWNTRDLDRVLLHYAPEIELISPTALRVVPESGGIIVGLSALRAYWTKALAGIPDLHFDLVEVLETVSGCTLLYRNQKQQTVSETFFWNEQGLVVKTSSSYGQVPLISPRAQSDPT